jgi:glycosyltransferase involved in cell wall biosynthesis
LGDYLCVGRPIITNPVGDIKTLFQNYEIGLFADYCEEDFCNKMIYLIENPEISSRFGENARKIAVNLLDWNIKVKDLENFYYQILNQNTHL